LIMFGDPRQETFLNEINYSTHVFSYGDSMSKIAFKEYGNAKYWWVIAWFNGKPTEQHVELGEVVQVPLFLDEALSIFGL